MKLSYIIAALEEFAPRTLQEAWDNSGLQIGLPDDTDEVTGALLCIDVTEEIVTEAAERGLNLIISHHPLIFKSLKSLTGANIQQRAAMAAIRAGIAVYSAHTSLDSTVGGVSYAMADEMGAKVLRVLSPADIELRKFTVIGPRTAAEDVRLALLDGEAGVAPCSSNSALSDTAPAIDSDSRCTYSDVEGSAMPAAQPDPIAGISLVHTPLTRVEAVVPAWRTAALAAAVAGVPGAEKARIEISPVDNSNLNIGLGVVAEFEKPMKMADFASMLKEKFGIPTIRTSLGYDPETTVRRIAMCGGAGGEFIGVAQAAGADAYVTADVRYHDFCDNRAGMAIFDIGHFESEQYATAIFKNVLSKKMPNFAVHFSSSQKNPVKYL